MERSINVLLAKVRAILLEGYIALNRKGKYCPLHWMIIGKDVPSAGLSSGIIEASLVAPPVARTHITTTTSARSHTPLVGVTRRGPPGRSTEHMARRDI